MKAMLVWEKERCEGRPCWGQGERAGPEGRQWLAVGTEGRGTSWNGSAGQVLSLSPSVIG